MNTEKRTLQGIFYPRSVAIVGASENPQNLVRPIYINMRDNGYQGRIYLVGRKEFLMEGAKVYKSMDDLPEPVDLAVLLTPAATVPALLAACGEKGVRYAIIESGGFSETGSEGMDLERELTKTAKQYGIRFTGPNGLGVVNTENGLATPFSPVIPPIRKGGVSIISQSGGMSLTLMIMMNAEGVGVNKVISAGNKADIDEIDYLSYLIEDPGAKVIAMYLEDIKQGSRFVELIRSAGKPVVIFKSNVHRRTAQIARSHASAIANDDVVVSQALREAGAIRTETLSEFIEAVKLLDISSSYGRKIAVLSRSGGHAVITQDAIVRCGFETPQFSGNFLNEVHKHMRSGVIQVTNPLDMGDIYDWDFYIRAVELALAEPSFDAVIFIHTYSGLTNERSSEAMATVFRGLKDKYDKPLLPLFFTEEETLNKLKKNIDYPFFTDPATMLATAARIREAAAYKRSDTGTVRTPPGNFLPGSKTTLSLMGSLNVMESYGIPVAPWAYARSRQELGSILPELGYPLAMKIESRNVSHKSDIGGVVLNITSEAAATDAYDQLTDGIKAVHPEIMTDGVVLQKMLSGPVELIIGARRDDAFGPVVIAGIGGLYAEILKDTALALCPVDETYALTMLQRLKGYALLAGARGRKPLALQEAARLIAAVSAMMLDRFNIVELDLNPVLLDEEKAIALDARVVVQRYTEDIVHKI